MKLPMDRAEGWFLSVLIIAMELTMLFGAMANVYEDHRKVAMEQRLTRIESAVNWLAEKEEK